MLCCSMQFDITHLTKCADNDVIGNSRKCHLHHLQRNVRRTAARPPGYSRDVTHLVCGRPYLTPTPTRGNALITFFTVSWSGKANITAAEEENGNGLCLVHYYTPYISRSVATSIQFQYMIVQVCNAYTRPVWNTVLI